MGIIITNSNPEYEKLNVELPFSRALNLRGVGFNSNTFPIGVGFCLWLYLRMVRDGRAIAQHGVGAVASLTQQGAGRERIPGPSWGWARICHDPMWSWVGRVPDPSWGWARMCPYLTWSWVRACHGPTLGWAQKKKSIAHLGLWFGAMTF
jgi:hypothetical protein